MTDSNVQFSVIIPLYNKEHFVARCINSVLAQTRQNFEIIVVDDGSTDRGPEVVRAMNDSRIRFVQQENGGASSARNRGAMEASFDLLAFIDADDEYLPRHLEAVEDLVVRYPQAGAYGTACWFLKANGSVRYVANRRALNGRYEGMVTNFFDGGEILWCCSGVVRKDVFNQVGGFDLQLRNGQDQDLWFRIAAVSSFAYTNDPQVIWHLGVPGSLSKSGAQSFRANRVLANHDRLLESSLPAERKSGVREYVRRSLISAMTVATVRGFPEYTQELFGEYRKRFGNTLHFRLLRPFLRSRWFCRLLLNSRRVKSLMGYLWYTYCRPPAWLTSRRGEP